MTAEAPPRVDNPYVGPTSFRLGDPLYGRDREQGGLLDLLVAERIVLLYSPSGAGKTSLIQAALAPALREAGFEVLPVIRVTHALEPGPGMPTPRNRYVLGTLLSLEEGVPPDRQRPVGELAGLTLPEYMAGHADRDGRPGNEVLVFDQFEEVLTADPTDEAAKHAFFRELGEMLRDRGHWALFSLREDFLAALDPYLRHVPTRFRSTFRLDLLTVPAALDAMRLPAQRAGVDFTEDAADQLVDDLRRVRVQQPGGATEDALGSYVEPVQLQVACRLLWSSLPPGSTGITRADVEALGDVDRALADYYADTVASIAAGTGAREAAIREWFEECLITPQGLRGQVLEGPDADGSAGGELLRRLVDAHLVRAERRRQATWYELAHDRLVEPVRRDNAAWRASHLTTFERAAALWAEQGRPDRLLLLGPDLAAAEEDAAVRQGALKARERDFLEASRRADEQQQRDARTAAQLRRSARRLRSAVALVTLLAVAAGGLAVWSWQAEARARQQEELHRLEAGAQRALAWDQDLAVALAAAAAEQSGSDGLGGRARDVLHLAASASPVSTALRGRGPATSAAISADGRTVVTAGAEGLQLWDRATGRLRDQLPLPDAAEVYGVVVGPEGRTVVAGFGNGKILVWDVATGRTTPWREATGWVSTVLLSPDGSRVGSIGLGNVARIWELDGTLLRSFTHPGASQIQGAAFSPEGDTLATVGDTDSAVLWDATSGDEVDRVPLPGGAWQVVVGPGSATIGTIGTIGTDQNAAAVWDVASKEARYRSAENPPATYRAFDPSLGRVLTVQPWGQVTVDEVATGTQLAQAAAPGAALTAAGFDVADPDQVLVLSEDADPAFWQTRAGDAAAADVATAGDQTFVARTDGVLYAAQTDGDERVVRTEQDTSVWELAADPDGGRLAAVLWDESARVWDARSGVELVAIGSGQGSLWDITFTSDGADLLIGSGDGRVIRWDATTGEELGTVYTPAGAGGSPAAPASQVEVSPDGTHVLVAFQLAPHFGSTSQRGPVALVLPLSGPGGEVRLELDQDGRRLLPGQQPERVTAAAFGRDGREVVVGTSKGRVAAFDVRDGTRSWFETVHGSAVKSLVIGPGGQVLTTGGDQRAVLSDPATGEVIRDVPVQADLRHAAFTPDGRHLMLTWAYGSLGTVPLADGELVDIVRDKVVRDLVPEECERYRPSEEC